MELYGTLLILRFVGKSVGTVLMGLQHLTRSQTSYIDWVRQCTVVVFGHMRTFVSLIEFVLLVTQRIQCYEPSTLLKRLIRSLTTSLGTTVLLTFRLYSICPNHRRIQRGRVGEVRTSQKFGQGFRVPVKYPQAPLIKQVLYLYCVMDTAENINVWHSLAWTWSN